MVIGRFHFRICALLAVLSPAVADAQSPRVSLDIGVRGVTLDARDSTMQEILDEWFRVGGLRLLNPERLDQRRMTLQLTDVTERQALEIVLRGIGGFVHSARGTNDTGRSQFGTLVVVPANTPLYRADGLSSASAAALQADELLPGNEAAQETQAEPVVLGARAAAAARSRASARNAGTNPGATDGTLQEPDVATAVSAEGVADLGAAPSVTPSDPRLLTPIQRPSEAPDAANPFGKVPGSATPGAIVTGAPPPGFVYTTPTTDPNQGTQGGRVTPR